MINWFEKKVGKQLEFPFIHFELKVSTFKLYVTEVFESQFLHQLLYE